MVDSLEDFHKKHGWIGVDLDGTLLRYNGWVSWNTFGSPIQLMADRIERWRDEGKDVRIFTARVGLPAGFYADGKPIYDRVKRHECKKTGTLFSDAMMVEAMHLHFSIFGIPSLVVQCYKDVAMVELWDDRCVQVVPNTGQTVIEHHEAERLAAQTPPLEIKEAGE